MLDKNNIFKTALIVVAGAILNTALIIFLYDQGLFNFGVEIVLPLNLLASKFFTYLLLPSISGIVILAIALKLAKQHYDIYGIDYIKRKLNDFKKEIILGYISIVVIFLVGRLFPAFAFGYCLLASLILGPILVLVLTLGHFIK